MRNRKTYQHHIVYISFLDGSDKFYVGKHSTNDLDDKYFGSGHWVRACLKAGRTFTKQIVWEFSSDEQAFKYEEILVDKMKAKYPTRCMNLYHGGNGNRVGTTLSQESRDKVAAASRGRKLPQSAIEKIRAANLGRKLSPEHAEKARIARLGKRHTPETLVKMKVSANSPEMLARVQKKVICNKTGIVFLSGEHAALHYGISKAMVSCLCNGKKSSKRFSFSFWEPK